MEMNLFAQNVQKKVASELGRGYQVKLQEVTKLNHVTMQGLLILSEEKNVSPTIYLDSFWEAYEGGASMEVIVEKILQIYREDTPVQNIDLDFFKDFEKVRDRICYRLVHREKNEAFLAGIPHIEFLDLAICFFYAYRGDAIGEGSILIHNAHVKLWDTDKKELLALAQKNTPRLFPWKCTSLGEIVAEILQGQEKKMSGTAESAEAEREWREGIADVAMKVLTNQSCVQGAACILYPDVLEELSAQAGVNFYILPSSIHEVILVADNGRETPEFLKEMIYDVNHTQVEPEEVLSDSLYYYDRKKKTVRIL
ncbi:MAG: DUF5688 family protein [Candidatus Gastranaerophilales bacterium]|nr:DUF5688 family protein [Candidatus Gastranaerophilales bacterium]